MKKILKYFLPLMLILTLMAPMQTYAAVGVAPAPQAAGTISFEDALQQALMLYINSGLDQNTAMARLQAILPQLMANPAAFLQIVQADLAALGILPGAEQEILAQQQAAQAQLEAQQAELLRQQQVATALQAQQQQAAQVRINPSGAVTYIGNSNSGKFHYPTCSSVLDMAAHNMVPFYGDRSEPIGLGYVPCKRCHP